MVAAAQEISAPLPRAIAADALKVSSAELALLLGDLRAIVVCDSVAQLRFFHGDFGRWVADGELAGAEIREAHERLAETLSELGCDNWSLAGPYVASQVLPYAIAAAERAAGQPSFGRSVTRFLDLLVNPGRLAADDTPWLSHLNRASALCSGSTTLPGTSVRIGGLARRLTSDLGYAVGNALSRPLSKSQLNEVGQFASIKDNAAVLAWLAENAKDYPKVVLAEARAQAMRVLSGWEPPVKDGTSAHTLASALLSEWRRSRRPSLLFDAVTSAEGAVELTPGDHEFRTGRLITLANALIARVDSDHEQPGDLDRLLEVQQHIVDRPDLADLAAVLEILASRLVRRAQRGADSAAADLDRAIVAAERAVELTPEDHERRTDRLITLANALWRGYLHQVTNADLGKAVDYAKQLPTEGGKYEQLLPPIRRLAERN